MSIKALTAGLGVSLDGIPLDVAETGTLGERGDLAVVDTGTLDAEETGTLDGVKELFMEGDCLNVGAA